MAWTAGKSNNILRGASMLRVAACALTLTLLPAPACLAAVSLPSILSEHMVLQRAADVPVWGRAAPGELVTVEFGAQIKQLVAGAEGRWRTDLDLRDAASDPATLTVRGQDNVIVVHDVLVGEVWFAAGQSNMEKPVGEQRGQKPTLNAQAEIAAANLPSIRLFKVPKKKAGAALDDVAGRWEICSPSSIESTRFSAAAYFFGRHLHQQLSVPVGLVDASWGGTRIDPWTAFPAGLAAGTDADAGQLFNGMVAALAPFAIRGAIWYQGESDVMEHEDPAGYTLKMERLVRGWRQQWGRDLAFNYVQLAPHLYHLVRRSMALSPDLLPRMWEAQADALRIPGTGMIVTTDLVDDLTDIHPRDKQSVGVRLANLALAGSYGRKGLLVEGPVFRSMLLRGHAAEISFEHGEGLASRDGKSLTWFDVAGADGRYFPAQAEIRGDKVILSSAYVAQPVAVRFGWDEAAQPNLVNRAGLPTRPFRTQR